MNRKKDNNLKNDNHITINLNDNMIDLIFKLAAFYNRKPAELLRILITPVLINEYAKIQTIVHPENAQPMEPAKFNNKGF